MFWEATLRFRAYGEHFGGVYPALGEMSAVTVQINVLQCLYTQFRQAARSIERKYGKLGLGIIFLSHLHWLYDDERARRD